MTEIGDTIFHFDVNRRVYRRAADGRATGGPIFRDHFIPAQVVGKEKNSWLVSVHGLPPTKVGMPGLEKGMGIGGYYTREQMEQRCFLKDHRYRISQEVGCLADVGLLKQIAALIEYKDC